MYDVMLDEANLWFHEHEPPLRKRKLEAPVYTPLSPVEDDDYSSDEDMNPVEREMYRLQVVEYCMGDATVSWDLNAIDDFYKGDLPDWPPKDDKLQFYEVKESELGYNEWLYLYAEAALFSDWHCDMISCTPFEKMKVVVQAKEDEVEVEQCNLLHEFQDS